MEPLNTRKKGNLAEDKAVEYLLQKGYTIVTRNYQSKMGEIDCIAQDGNGTLVFIEVKSTENKFLGHPFFRITKAKQAKLYKMALLYLNEHQLTKTPCRFDAIAIQDETIEHLKNAFLV